MKKKIKKLLTKKTMRIWWGILAVILVAVFWFPQIFTSKNLSASVMDLLNQKKMTISKQTTTKQLMVSNPTSTTRPAPTPTPVPTTDTCTDSDGGKNYATKWTITTVISLHTRVEQDSCNSDGTLREWFCGNPWDAAWLLRSENYVNCGAGYQCQNGACIQQPQWTGDAIIQKMYISPNANPIVGTDNTTNTVNIVIKNVGNGVLNIPKELGVYRFFFDCNYIGGNWGFRTTPITSATWINPGNTLITQLEIWFSNDIYNWYNSLWSRYIQCTIISQQQQWYTNPSPSQIDVLYELDGNNNTYTLNYNVVNATWTIPTTDGYGDIIIQSLTLLPNTTPALYSDFTTNSFQVTVKNIGTWTMLLPMNLGDATIHIPFVCYFPDGGDGWIDSQVISQNTLGPNQSITTTLQTAGMPATSFFWAPWTKSMTCEVVTQQQQLPVNPGLVTWINNPYMMYETDWTNNSFTTTYQVIGQPATSGDIVIDSMYITPNANPTVGTNNDTNKINLVMKNIGAGVINIPVINWGNRFSLMCNYGNGSGPSWGSNWWFVTTAVSGTTLQPNASVTVQLNEQGNDYYSRFDTTGAKFITCTAISQQQQWRQTPDPTNTNFLYESNGTNNTRTLDYTVQ